MGNWRRAILDLACAWALLKSPASPAADCNGNRLDDAKDIAVGRSLDCNSNGIPDECELRRQLSLNLGAKINLGGYPSSGNSLAMGDLDGDGDVDLAMALDPAGLLSVLLNQGDGSFGMPRMQEALGGQASMVSADLDGDGDLDLAMASGVTPEVRVLINGGHADFAPGPTVSLATKSQRLIALDLDGDGKRDILVNSYDSLGITLLRNRGDGAFDAAQLAVKGFAQAADLDGDGFLDLLAAPSSRLTIQWGAGGGRFMPQTLPGLTFSTVAAADFDGDGWLDLAGGYPQMDVNILKNQGARKFSSPFKWRTASPPPRISGAADLDDDLLADLIVNGGDFHFPLSALFNDGGFEFTEVSLGVSGSFLGMADLNGNGLLDPVLYAFEGSSMHLLFQDSPRTFRDVKGPPAAPGAGSVQAVDVDGDGRLDLVTLGSLTTVHRNRGDRSFAPPALYAGGGNLFLASDMDGDGHLDLVTSTDERWAPLTLLMNLGDGTFRSTEIDPEGGIPLLADMDGDGRLDLVAAQTFTLKVFLGPGAAAPAPPREYQEHVWSMTAADLNGDGDLDLAVTDADLRDVEVRLNLGGGDLGDPSPAVPNGMGGIPWQVQPYDLDQDGYLDLVVPNAPTPIDPGFVSILENRGDGTFNDPVDIPVGNTPNSVHLIDIDEDGAVDILAFLRGAPSNPGPMVSGVALLWGSSSYQDQTLLPVAGDSDHRSFRLGDVDGDGRPDIVTNSHFPAGITFYLNEGKGSFRSQWIALPETDNAFLTDVADVDGDALLDVPIVWGGSLSVLWNATAPPRSQDGNGDSMPDECQRPRFHRGDASGDGRLELSDAVFVLARLFLAGDPPGCIEAADTNGDGLIDITDAVVILGYLFLAGPPPAEPGPPPLPCGTDSDLPGSPGDLGCLSYAGR